MVHSALLNNIKRNIVAKKVCEPKVISFKGIISDIVADPYKFNDYPNLAYLVHSVTLDIDDLSPGNMDFSNIKTKVLKEGQKPTKENMKNLRSLAGDLSEELGIEELEYCITEKSLEGFSPEQFFHLVMKDNKDFETYKCIHDRADKVADREVIYKVDADDYDTIMIGCFDPSFD